MTPRFRSGPMLVAVLVMSVTFAGGATAPANAADPAEKAASPGGAPITKREYIYGAELMTGRERERYRERVRGAQAGGTEQAVREEHRTQIRERARKRGVQLEEPAGVVIRGDKDR